MWHQLSGFCLLWYLPVPLWKKHSNWFSYWCDPCVLLCTTSHVGAMQGMLNFDCVDSVCAVMRTRTIHWFTHVAVVITTVLCTLYSVSGWWWEFMHAQSRLHWSTLLLKHIGISNSQVKNAWTVCHVVIILSDFLAMRMAVYYN